MPPIANFGPAASRGRCSRIPRRRLRATHASTSAVDRGPHQRWMRFDATSCASTCCRDPRALEGVDERVARSARHMAEAAALLEASRAVISTPARGRRRSRRRVAARACRCRAAAMRCARSSARRSRGPSA
jgi:hypothetical protein